MLGYIVFGLICAFGGLILGYRMGYEDAREQAIKFWKGDNK